MNSSSDNFDRRRFLKSDIPGILNTTGLTSTFAQTNWGKKPGPNDGGNSQPIIRL